MVQTCSHSEVTATDFCVLCVGLFVCQLAHLTGKVQEINCVVLYYVTGEWNHLGQSPTVTSVTHKDKYYSLGSQRLNPEPSKQKQTKPTSYNSTVKTQFVFLFNHRA